MSDWKPLDVSEDELEGTDTSDFSSTPEQLHSEFQTSATHLHEVQSMHKHVLVQAGMIPETHIAEVEPTQRLEWVLEELHGMSNPDGLTIPLLGVAPEQLEVQVKELGSETHVKISIQQEGSAPFERVLPLNSEQAETLQVHFVNGRLHLRW
ncbi:hypothetical protein N9V58_01160 [Candidatus Poseidoniales archaeon]|nr:hypothetical protein [Candidatus Poseidoniales archaeon]MDB2333941.1 hypothetical protein [Candidatus Poseidoniales archaeon]MDB2348388.1 hypothetical protein [Candidatus Poseidoniales archaeon]MDB2366931.1 hypothetical protein [Candidatus Poseidoniales archaeon]MDB2672218.1 hypothetical protein [Candidatus Poseidoniales archaeon]|tara:strand:+ start:1868 stop:2323 length:456 start_codon:yes stop_codon:yes gene_type:complete